MNKLLIPVITSILILGGIGLSYDVFADKDDNNGKSQGCDNANEKSKVSEKNPHCDNPTISISSLTVGSIFTISDPQIRFNDSSHVVFCTTFSTEPVTEQQVVDCVDDFNSGASVLDIDTDNGVINGIMIVDESQLCSFSPHILAIVHNGLNQIHFWIDISDDVCGLPPNPTPGI